MPITLSSNSTTCTFKAHQVFKRKKWRVFNIPLVNEDPYSLNLGLEISEVELMGWMDETQLSELDALVNPVQVTSSSYVEVPTGWYNFEKTQAVRKAAQVQRRECTLTLIRDFHHA